MNTLSERAAPILLTMGDPAGIGPDVTLGMWARRGELALPPIALLACPALLSDRARLLNIDLSLHECTTLADVQQDRDVLDILPLKNTVRNGAGEPDPDNAAAVIESIERAVSLTLSGSAAAVVTNPIAKAQLYAAGFSFPGHTEFLAELARKHDGKIRTPVMMLAGPKLRTVPVTIHIPLRSVPSALSTDLIVETATVTATDLMRRFAISRPRLAVAGLNPHAGEDGAIGSEDADIIEPAVTLLRSNGLDAVGPMPADTMFHESARDRYDVAICMYHDQALIPAKALGFDDAVNTTLGLPFIRTSPDHGTAFDIAGKGIARPGSLVAAVRMAGELAANTSGDP